MTREIIVCAHWRGFGGATCETNLPMSITLESGVVANDVLRNLITAVKEGILKAEPDFKADGNPHIDNVIWLPMVEEGAVG